MDEGRLSTTKRPLPLQYFTQGIPWGMAASSKPHRMHGPGGCTAPPLHPELRAPLHMKTISLTLAALSLTSAPALAVQATWTTLGTGQAADMSDDAQFVAGFDGGNAFLWSASGGQANIGQDDAVAVTADGSAVLGNMTDINGRQVAGRWTLAGGWVAIGGLGGSSGGSISSAYGMSADGTVGTGLGWINAGTAGAFRWTQAGGMSALPQLGPNSSRGNCVSEDGAYIGGWDEASNGTRRAAVWDGTLSEILVAVTATNPSGAGEVWGFSNNNTYVAGTTEGEGFVWDAGGGLTKTGALPTGDPFALGEARAVSNDGSRVVGWYRVAFPFDNRATIWTPGGGIQELKTVLEANGASGVPNLTAAFAISGDGSKILATTDSGTWGIANLGATSGLGTPYCFCDSTAPCGNLGAADAGCANSTGNGAILSASGSLSVSADDMTLDCDQMAGNKPCLLFAGTGKINGGLGTIFGDGLRCAGGSIRRLGVRTSNGTGTATWGPGLIGSGSWSSGDLRNFQVWYRDPAGPCNGTFNLSNGLEITFQP